MLLRRRLTGLDAYFGLLHETPPPAGGAPTGDPAPGAPAPQADPAPGGGGAPAQTQPPEPDRAGWIPRSRFDEINAEYRKLKEAEEARQADEAKKRGDYEKLEAQSKAKLEEAEAKAVRIARRAAFIAKAAGTLSDADAGYKLALADGMLDDLKVDDEGDADPKAVEKIVEKLTEKYAFLKATSNGSGRDFGGPRGGAGGTPRDTSKMNADEILRAGYAETGNRR